MIITILRWYFKILLRLYYRNIVINNFNIIDNDKPQLFVANHQNSLVDGLLFITQINKDVIMTTTSTVTKFPLVDKILKRANVEIFYRRLDGYSEQILEKNVDSIVICADRLAQHNKVLIFPEGLTTEDGRILPFKTGFARIASSYINRYNQDLEVVPIYINYSNREKIRSDISIDIKEPLMARKYQNKFGDDFVSKFTEEVRHRLLEVEEQKLEKTEESFQTESSRVLDRILALPFILFHLIPSALVILLGDKINPKKTTKATTRVFLSLIIFPIIYFLQLIFIISLLPILWVYFLMSYLVIFLYRYSKSMVTRVRKSTEKPQVAQN